MRVRPLWSKKEADAVSQQLQASLAAVPEGTQLPKEAETIRKNAQKALEKLGVALANYDVAMAKKPPKAPKPMEAAATPPAGQEQPVGSGVYPGTAGGAVS